MIDYQKYYQKIILTLESAAKKYQEYFVENDYLIFSPAFKEQPYYEVKARPENFLHLTGLKVNIDPYTFYKDCLYQNIDIEKLNLNNTNISRKISRVVKPKLSVINDIFDVFSIGTTLVEENFKKNTISCNISVSENTFTLGFVKEKGVLKPKTLLKGNYLDLNNAELIDLVLMKKRKDKKYNTILVGNLNIFKKYYPSILNKEIIDEKKLSNFSY